MQLAAQLLYRVEAVQMLGSTVACLSPMKNGFDPGPVHVGFVDRLFSQYFGFLLWLSCHSCSRLTFHSPISDVMYKTTA